VEIHVTSTRKFSFAVKISISNLSRDRLIIRDARDTREEKSANIKI